MKKNNDLRLLKCKVCALVACILLLIGCIVIFVVLNTKYNFYDYNMKMKIIASTIPIVSSLPYVLGFIFHFYQKCIAADKNLLYIDKGWAIYGIIVMVGSIILQIAYSALMGFAFDRNGNWLRFIYDNAHSGLFVSVTSLVSNLLAFTSSHIVLSKTILGR